MFKLSKTDETFIRYRNQYKLEVFSTERKTYKLNNIWKIQQLFLQFHIDEI